MKINFQIQGSEVEPYLVTFSKVDGTVQSSCNCNDAINGNFCKHRLSLLVYSSTNIVSGNLGDLKLFLTEIRNTDFMNDVTELVKVEKERKDAENIAAKAKTKHIETKKMLSKKYDI